MSQGILSKCFWNSYAYWSSVCLALSWYAARWQTCFLVHAMTKSQVMTWITWPASCHGTLTECVLAVIIPPSLPYHNTWSWSMSVWGFAGEDGRSNWVQGTASCAQRCVAWPWVWVSPAEASDQPQWSEMTLSLVLAQPRLTPPALYASIHQSRPVTGDGDSVIWN